MKQDRIHKFVTDQLSCWPLACGNFRALKSVRVREVGIILLILFSFSLFDECGLASHCGFTLHFPYD